MSRLSVFVVLLFMTFNWAHAGNTFKPHVVESEDDAVCELVLDHYTRLFESDDENTAGLKSSEEVNIPEFSEFQVDGIKGHIKLAEVDFYGVEKVFAYHARSHSWRGTIYTGYVVSPGQVEGLKAQLNEKDEGEISAFYPMGSLRAGSNFTWWENLPFQFNDTWYVLGDFGDFYRNESIRKVYRIGKGGTSKAVCSVKIFQNFDEEAMGEQFPFFSAYRRSVEEIMLSPGSCGTSRPEASAKSEGRFFSSMAISRPWAVEPTWKDMNTRVGKRRTEFQKKHFEDWKYQDVWSYREHETYENLAVDAVAELKNHYIKNYSYSDSSALEHASRFVDSMPGRYYSLGVYSNEGKDFSFFDRILDGTYGNWREIQSDLELKYGEHPLASLSLMVDNPHQYEMLPPDLGLSAVKTSYNKDVLMFAAHMNNYDSVKYLIDAGWPVDNVTSNEDGYICGPRLKRLNRSALTYAAENASIEVMRLLVDAGADVNIEDSQGNPLDYYLRKNPRFSEEEATFGFKELLRRHPESEKVKPSFSCASAVSKIESAICNSVGLAIYDRELNESYRKVLRDGVMPETLKRSQIEWIKKRRSECGGVSEAKALNGCLARTTRARIRYLRYLHSSYEK